MFAVFIITKSPIASDASILTIHRRGDAGFVTITARIAMIWQRAS
jgi:hypothetical protein